MGSAGCEEPSVQINCAKPVTPSLGSSHTLGTWGEVMWRQGDPGPTTVPAASQGSSAIPARANTGAAALAFLNNGGGCGGVLRILREAAGMEWASS